MMLHDVIRNTYSNKALVSRWQSALTHKTNLCNEFRQSYRDLHMSFLENAGTSVKKRTVSIWGSVTSVDNQAPQTLLYTVVVMYISYTNIKILHFSHTTCV